MLDGSPRPCPSCYERGRRVIAPGAGVVFKGKGWHKTDYDAYGPRREKKGEE